MKSYLSIIGLFLIASISFAQQNLTGKITSENNQPLENVAIQIIENNSYTISNADGFYQFNNAPKGNITLVVYLFGYEQKTQKINTAEVTELNFTLNEKEQHLDEVI